MISKIFVILDILIGDTPGFRKIAKGGVESGDFYLGDWGWHDSQCDNAYFLRWVTKHHQLGWVFQRTGRPFPGSMLLGCS